MTSSKITPTTIIAEGDAPIITVSDEVNELLGRQKEFGDALLDVFVRQLKLIHAMMVELPFAWAAREEVARGEAAPATDAPRPAASPAASAVVPPPMAAALGAEDLMPATRKHKKPASGEPKMSEPKIRKAASKPPAKKPSRKGPAPTPLH